MRGNLDEAFGFHEGSLRLRIQRQQLLASNIANADTPNYKARDLDFSKALQGQLMSTADAASLKQTNPAHLGVRGGSRPVETQLRAASQNSQDGNTVDLDIERAAFAENALHYEAELALTNARIKSLLAVLQG